MPNSKDDEQRQRLARSILTSCIMRVGGSEAFANRFGVTRGEVNDWLDGKSQPPIDVVEKAVASLLLEAERS